VVLYQMLTGRPPFVGTPESLMYRVVNDMPLPPSAAEGAMHGDRFDRAVATALAKDPSERYASAAAFRNAVSAALGQPVPPMVSQEAVHALPMPTEYAPTERITPLHVGPLAGVLVRRASRLCHDLPALQAALAEQITNVAAREAFWARDVALRAARAVQAQAPGAVRVPAAAMGMAATGRAAAHVRRPRPPTAP
jgi:hypothetical protein